MSHAVRTRTVWGRTIFCTGVGFTIKECNVSLRMTVSLKGLPITTIFVAQINVSATVKLRTNATILWCFGLMMVNVTHSIQEDHVKKVNARSECHLLRFLHNPKFVCRQAASDREGQIGWMFGKFNRINIKSSYVHCATSSVKMKGNWRNTFTAQTTHATSILLKVRVKDKDNYISRAVNAAVTLNCHTITKKQIGATKSVRLS